MNFENKSRIILCVSNTIMWKTYPRALLFTQKLGQKDAE